MVVVLPVPLTPTMRTTAGWPAAAGLGRQPARRAAEVPPARPERRPPPSRSSFRRRARSTTSIGQHAADVAGDQQLLDRVPVGCGRARLQQAPQTRHEAAAAPLAGPRSGLRERPPHRRLGVRPRNRGSVVRLRRRLDPDGRWGLGGDGFRCGGCRLVLGLVRLATQEQGTPPAQSAAVATFLRLTSSARSRASSRRRLITRLTASSPTVTP